MKKYIYFFMVILFPALVIAAVSSSPFLNEIHPEGSEYFLYLCGLYNDYENNFAKAEECFDILLKFNPTQSIYSGYFEHLFKTNQYQHIIQLYPNIKDIIKNDIDIPLFFVKSLELTGQTDQANNEIIQLYKHAKNNIEVAYGAALAYTRKNEPHKALAILDEYLQTTPIDANQFIFYFLKTQILLGMHKKKEALETIKICIDLNPLFQQGWLISGLLNEMNGNVKEAITGYQTFLHLVGSDFMVEQQLLALLNKKGYTNPSAQHKTIFEEALTHYYEKNYDKSLQLLNTYLKYNPDYKPARLLKIEVLCNLKQFETAINLLSKWIQKNHQENDWYRALHLLYLANVKKDHIIQILTTLSQKFPKSLYAKLYISDLLIREKKLPQAQKILDMALTLTKNSELQAKIIFQISSIIYLQNNSIKKYITQAQQITHTYLPLLNLQSYYAAKNNDFAQAQSLIKIIHEKDPNNSHYQHTQAYILYKQGNYAQAEKVLRNLSGIRDYYIFKHTAKIMKHNGELPKAIELMKIALANASSERQRIHSQKMIQLWKKQ